MEAICRKILGVGKAKPARWGLQRQFPGQRKRQTRRNLIQRLNQNMSAPRPRMSTRKQFGPVRTRNMNNRYPPLPPSPLSLPASANNYSTISSLNNEYAPLPVSPVGSENSRYTANTQNSVNVPWPGRGGRRTHRRRH